MSTILTPPRPFGCRRSQPLPPIFSLEPFEDERAERFQLHDLLDESLADVPAPGDTLPVRPSNRLYTPDFTRPPRDRHARDSVAAVWQARWPLARVQDAAFRSVATTLLTALGAPLLCRNSRSVPAHLLAYVVGRSVHYRIMAAYRSVHRGDRISCDNRVFFPDGSSQPLSELAAAEPRGEYGALNWCLAGQRADIINLDRGEMWEIKPASLCSSALMQLWGYLDNYEVARVYAYYDGDGVLPPIRPGMPARLPDDVLRPFPLRLSRDTVLTITPFTLSDLPGLILYDLEVSKPRRPQAADSVAVRLAMRAVESEVTEVLRVARGDARYLIKAKESETRKQVIATAVLVVLTLAVGGAGVALGAGGTGAAAGGMATGGAAVEGTTLATDGLSAAQTAGVLAQIQRLASTTAANQVALEMIRDVPRVAATVTVYLAGRQFTVPPELATLCLAGGCRAGVAAGSGSR